MGTVLDAFALIALLRNEPAADAVEALIAAGDAAMSTVNLAEVGQKVVREGAMLSADLEHIVGTLPLAIVPFTAAHAYRTAELRARHHGRGDSAVSLADCCLVAVATPADRVATADAVVLRMAEAEGIGTVALPPP